jgi:hypothetical protein
MKALPQIAELLWFARHVIWFETPKRALVAPIQFLGHVMVFGTVEDLKALRGIASARTNIAKCWIRPRRHFDARSWTYWNLVCGRHPGPPLPVRTGLPVFPPDELTRSLRRDGHCNSCSNMLYCEFNIQGTRDEVGEPVSCSPDYGDGHRFHRTTTLPRFPLLIRCRLQQH